MKRVDEMLQNIDNYIDKLFDTIFRFLFKFNFNTERVVTRCCGRAEVMMMITQCGGAESIDVG